MNETEDCDLSLGGNVWNVAQTDERRTEQMCRRLEISSSMAKLLILRGITEDNAPLTSIRNYRLPCLTPAS